MASALRGIFWGLALAVLALGFVYFGPSEYTGILKRNPLFVKYVGKPLDEFLGTGSGGGAMIADIEQISGNVEYRAPSALSSVPARGGESLRSGTVVSTSRDSSATIRLVDKSLINLESNSTVVVELTEDEKGTASVNLKVVQGQVWAEKSKSTKSKLRASDSRGKQIALKSQERVLVAANAQAEIEAAEEARRREAERLAAQKAEEERRAAEEARLQAEREKELLAQEQAEKERQAQIAKEQEAARLNAERAAQERRKAAALEEARKAKLLAEAQKAQAARVPASLPPSPLKTYKFEKPAEGADLAQALYKSKTGQVSESRQYLARALTNSGYSSTAFNDATRVALDGVLEGYLEAGECKQGVYTLNNVIRSYAKQAEARKWVEAWKERFRNSTCF